MINNLEIIKNLLTFEKEGDFYMLYILKRKKDFPDEEKNNHQSVRTIKTYCISSIEYLERRWEEIVTLSEIFQARVYIHVQKQNHFDVGLNMMVELAQRLKDGVYDQRNLFESVVGQLKTYEKRWVVDIDSKDERELISVITAIEDCNPIEFIKAGTEYKGKFYPMMALKNKVIEVVPTRKGFHVITKPFNVAEFNKLGFNHDIQKKNPTLLYYPNSLETNKNIQYVRISL